MKWLRVSVDFRGSLADGSQRREIEDQAADVCRRHLLLNSLFRELQPGDTLNNRARDLTEERRVPLIVISGDYNEISVLCDSAGGVETYSADRSPCNKDW
jgi:hypothetical protein